MRRLFIGWFFLSLGLAQQPRWWDADRPSAWGSVTNGWQLALRAEKQSFLSGEVIAVSLSALNGTAAPGQVIKPKSGWLKAQFNIKRVEGGPLIPLRSPKDHFDQLARGGLGSIVSQVQPGEVTNLGVVDLGVLFDLSPEIYHVQALWREPTREHTKTPNVLSNEITISVVAR